MYIARLQSFRPAPRAQPPHLLPTFFARSALLAGLPRARLCRAAACRPPRGAALQCTGATQAVVWRGRRRQCHGGGRACGGVGRLACAQSPASWHARLLCALAPQPPCAPGAPGKRRGGHGAALSRGGAGRGAGALWQPSAAGARGSAWRASGPTGARALARRGRPAAHVLVTMHTLKAFTRRGSPSWPFNGGASGRHGCGRHCGSLAATEAPLAAASCFMSGHSVAAGRMT